SASSMRWTMMRSCSGLTFMLVTPSVVIVSGRSLAAGSRAARLPNICASGWDCQQRTARRWAGRVPLEFVLAPLAGESVAVDAERACRPGEAAVATAEDFRDETLLELVNGVLEVDASVDHLFHELVQAVADHHPSSLPVRRRNASMYFSRVFST